MESSARIKDLQNQTSALKSSKSKLTNERSQKTERIDDYVLDNVDLRSYNRDAVMQLKN